MFFFRSWNALKLPCRPLLYHRQIMVVRRSPWKTTPQLTFSLAVSNVLPTPNLKQSARRTRLGVRFRKSFHNLRANLIRQTKIAVKSNGAANSRSRSLLCQRVMGKILTPDATGPRLWFCAEGPHGRGTGNAAPLRCPAESLRPASTRQGAEDRLAS